MHALLAFDEDLDRPVGKLEELENLAPRAHAVKIVKPRLLDFRLALGDEDNRPLVSEGVIESQDRLGATDKKGRDHAWENHDVPKREEGETHRVGAIRSDGGRGLSHAFLGAGGSICPSLSRF